MAKKEVLNLEVKSNIKSVVKDTEILQAKIENANLETKDMINNFGAFGITVGGIKEKFKDVSKIMTNGLINVGRQAKLVVNSFKLMFGGQMAAGAKVLFSVIRAGIAATGIGALVVAFGSLVQYFRDSEDGASKFKQITSQLGVVVGNVTDIVSNLGKSLFKLMTGDFKGFKDGLADVTQGVKDFGATTKKEMEAANQLEKDRLALQKFEREAIIEKAKTEKDIMKLRLQARDFEKFSAEERLGFMREANKLADEQLQKDLHVAKEKLRFQQVENSFSKSTQENLDAEAQLQAQVFQIERSNFSERKRMKSEEQAVVRELSAAQKALDKQEQDRIAAKNKKDEEDRIAKETKAKKEADILLALQQENTLALIDDLKERALAELKIKEDKEKAEAELLDNAEAVKLEIEKKYARERGEVEKKFAEDQVKWSEMSSKQQRDIASKTAGDMATILGEETAAGKAFAIIQTTIDTFSSAQAAYKAMAGIPVVGPALGGIAAAAAVAAGMKNIQAIKGAGGDGGGGGGNLSAATTGIQPPAPQMMSGAFELGSTIEDPEPIKAFVVTDEMTQSQNQLANIRRRATI